MASSPPNTSAGAGPSSAPAPAAANPPDVNALLQQPQLLESLKKMAAEGKITPDQMSKVQLLFQLREKAGAAQAGTAQAATAASPAAPVPIAPAATPAPPARVQPAAYSATPPAGYRATGSGQEALLVSNSVTGDTYSLPQTPDLNTSPVAWPIAQQGRPSLTGGIPGGRLPGTPANVARLNDDVTMITTDDSRSRRKNTPGDQSMRRSIQDLVSSIDPNVKVEAEVEDLLLEIADEFIDSVTNFGCRLAKHRGADTLEVKDLQLHLERNHNIRIPGFASDETRFSTSQTANAAAAPAAPAKKSGQGTHMTLRSHRLAQVQQAKRDGKLL